MPFPPEARYKHGGIAKTGILLINLGTPQAPTAAAVRAYLREFLSDPRVVEISRPLWWLILNGLVLRTRPRKSAAKYALIWTKEGSPLAVHTAKQATLLKGYLGERIRTPHLVVWAMRYGQPSVQKAMLELRDQGCDRVLVLPLYPQYSASTTGSAFDAVFATTRQMRNVPALMQPAGWRTVNKTYLPGAPLYEIDDELQKADLNQQNATLANAQQTYDRAASLSRTGSGTQANFDAAVSALRVAEARVISSQTRLARRNGFAPVGGIIQQIYFREGEMVPAQRPVLSIMPPGNMKLRFFVPEPDLPKLAVGDEVRVTCDNCAADLTAKIYFVATAAEYTPPVIYSLEERSKLVYLIQARPNRPDALRVGQPIAVFRGVKTPVADKR